MSLPASFSNNTSPTGVQLDNNNAALANMAIWNTSATGTNAIALTTTSNQPAVSAYADRQRFQFIGPNNSSGSVTVAVNSLSALPLYLITGVQAGSGDIASGTPYLIIYLSALNSGNGGFQILSAVPSSAIVAATVGCARGLLMFNNSSTPSTKIDITAGQTVMVTTGGAPKFVTSVSVTIDLTTTGANGMDTGARPTSGWAYCYLISNGSVTAGLASATSPTSAGPTMPGGYTYAAYIGAMFCDASQNLLRSRQVGRDVSYTVTSATNTAAMPVFKSGSTGSVTVPTYTSTSVTALVPLTAGLIWLVLTNQGATNIIAIVAPNANYGAWNSATNPPPIALSTGATGSYTSTAPSKIELESSNVHVAANSASSIIYVYGFTDYYSAGS